MVVTQWPNLITTHGDLPFCTCAWSEEVRERGAAAPGAGALAPSAQLVFSYHPRHVGELNPRINPLRRGLLKHLNSVLKAKHTRVGGSVTCFTQGRAAQRPSATYLALGCTHRAAGLVCLDGSLFLIITFPSLDQP